MGRTIRLESVTSENRDVCLALQVELEQQRFISEPLSIITAARVYPDTTLRAVVSGSGEVVGLVSFGIEPGTGYHKIFRLLIDKAYQGRGYGRSAMRAVMDRIAELGATEVHIAWTYGNRAAEHLYMSLGFVQLGVVEDTRTGGTKVVASCQLDL